MVIPYVNVRDFTPNAGRWWTPVGTMESVTQVGNTFLLTLAGGERSLQVSFLSPTAFRVRFDPSPGADYSSEVSVAVVTRALGPATLTIVEKTPETLLVDTGAMQVRIDLRPYRIRVFRGGQLVSADEPSYNLVYIPGQLVTANFKTRPAGARYSGFGEKAGAQLLKNEFTMTQFNYDNFRYRGPTVPSGTTADELNPSIALYASIPFMVEVNPAPSGAFAGPPYAYGLFFDNGGQSYFNMGSNDYSDMGGKFYFGGLFNEMDYYFFLGSVVGDVLAQYTQLTGRAPMPPKYVLGFHQGAYGYFERSRLEAVASAYRAHRIPCDGLHIDVDFQDNYRTFTHSEMKFHDAAGMLAGLRAKGFRCSTNVTPVMTDNPLDENAKVTPYAQRAALAAAGGLIFETYAGQGPSPRLFTGHVNYGENDGFNPFPYPPLRPNDHGRTPLGTFGNYPDLGRADVRALWGRQYAHLIRDLGMDMIWQDMMCPALDRNDHPNGTFPLDLMVNNDAAYVPNGVCHNLYALFVLMATWEGLAALRPERRNFVIARGGYAGMQRYAGLWTGDSAASWEFLRINLPEVLNLGLSGVPLSGCDIGGFAEDSGSVTNDTGRNVTHFELFTRWMHLGAFLPWYRNHYNGYTKSFQEPFRYGEPVPSNCRKYVELRYRMLQIFYDAVYEWTQTGMPIARALFLNDPFDLAVYDHLDDEFFVGRDVLVAPILFPAPTPGAPAVRSVYVPAGSDWYSFQDDQARLEPAVPGGTLITNWIAGLDVVPIYVRDGAVLPMRSKVEQYVGELDVNPLELTVYPGTDRTYTLYQDDGITTRAASAGEFRSTSIEHRAVPGGTSLRVRRAVDKYTPAEPYYTVRFLESAPPDAVTVAGAAVPQVASAAQMAGSGVDCFFWDSDLHATIVKVFDTSPDATVVVRPEPIRG